MKKIVWTLTALPILLMSSVTASLAQDGQPARSPVAVVISPDLQGDGAYLVERRVAHTPYDVIHLRPQVGEGVLRQAVWALVTAREREGSTPTAASRFRLSPDAGKRIGQRELSWVRTVLEDLKTAEVVRIDGVGEVQAVIIFLPNSLPRQP